MNIIIKMDVVFYSNKNVLKPLTLPPSSDYDYGYFAKNFVDHVATIPEGYYTVQELQREIRNQMNLILHDISETFPLHYDIIYDLLYDYQLGPTIVILYKGITNSLHKLSIYINPITYKTTFINRLETLKIYCIQTLTDSDSDVFGKQFSQPFVVIEEP